MKIVLSNGYFYIFQFQYRDSVPFETVICF